MSIIVAIMSSINITVNMRNPNFSAENLLFSINFRL